MKRGFLVENNQVAAIRQHFEPTVGCSFRASLTEGFWCYRIMLRVQEQDRDVDLSNHLLGSRATGSGAEANIASSQRSVASLCGV